MGLKSVLMLSGLVRRKRLKSDQNGIEIITRDIDNLDHYRKTVEDLIRWLQIDLQEGDEW